MVNPTAMLQDEPEEGPTPVNITPQRGVVFEAAPANGTIEYFINKFVEDRHAPTIKLKPSASMKELRHFVPMLMLQLFGKRQDASQRKMKGLWTDKPPCWPHDLPFADPNNGRARPKKDVLVKTAEFLIKLYVEREPFLGTVIHQETGHQLTIDTRESTPTIESEEEETSSRNPWPALLECTVRCGKSMKDKALFALPQGTRDHLLQLLDTLQYCDRDEVGSSCKLAHEIEATLDEAVILGEISNAGETTLENILREHLPFKPITTEIMHTATIAPVVTPPVVTTDIIVTNLPHSNQPVSMVQHALKHLESSDLKKEYGLASLTVDGSQPYEVSAPLSSQYMYTNGLIEGQLIQKVYVPPGPEPPMSHMVQPVPIENLPIQQSQTSATEGEPRYHNLETVTLPTVTATVDSSASQYTPLQYPEGTYMALANINLNENDSHQFHGKENERPNNTPFSYHGNEKMIDSTVEFKEENCPEVANEVEVEETAMEEVSTTESTMDTSVVRHMDPQHNGVVNSTQFSPKVHCIPKVVSEQESSDGDSEKGWNDYQLPPRKRRRNMIEF